MTQNESSPIPVLKTERLTLRQLQPADEEAIFALRSDPEVNKFLGRKPASTIDDARAFIDRVTDTSNSSFYWAITFQEEKELLGTICLFGFAEQYESCEIGYELRPGFQKQGIMKEALEQVLNYAFQKIGVQKIDAFFHRDNQGSLNLLEKFSFKKGEPDESEPDLLHYELVRGK